jgi:hypothetical protein
MINRSYVEFGTWIDWGILDFIISWLEIYCTAQDSMLYHRHKPLHIARIEKHLTAYRRISHMTRHGFGCRDNPPAGVGKIVADPEETHFINSTVIQGIR